MKNQGIVLLGLGPGDSSLMTRKAWDVIGNASEIYLRTEHHPAVEDLPDHLLIHSFDDLYEKHESFDKVYEEIVTKILELGKRDEGVIYAVPGHPFAAETTTIEISRQAKELGIDVHVVDGLSFIEPIFSAIDEDPLPHTAIIDAIELASHHFPSFPPDQPVLIAQVYSRHIAAELKLTLMALYPDDHMVKLIHAAGTEKSIVENVLLHEIDKSQHIDLLTSMYLPPLPPNTSLEAFQEIIAHLRAPDGCPWDREQTHQSLRPNLLEEAYEVLMAIDADDPEEMKEEFGDLLLQIVLHAQIASEYGEFTMSDVIKGIHEKIVRRHPHVFGTEDLSDVDGVVRNWEKLKAEERKENGQKEKGVLEGVSASLPSLVQAETYQKRVARVGFDWNDINGVYEKITEEIAEVQDAVTKDERTAEIGDLLFAVVNLARWFEIDAESALREANARFRRRFERIEMVARKEDRDLSDYSFDELDDLWNKAKKG